MSLPRKETGKGFDKRGTPIARTRFVRKKKAEGKKRRNYTPQYSTLSKEGKTGRENRKALRVFKKDAARYSIDGCEARYEGCTGKENLTWAHGRKRRELQGDELQHFAIVCCAVCHRRLDEGMSHERMANEVSRIIALRPERYLEAA